MPDIRDYTERPDVWDLMDRARASFQRIDQALANRWTAEDFAEWQAERDAIENEPPTDIRPNKPFGE